MPDETVEHSKPDPTLALLKKHASHSTFHKSLLLYYEAHGYLTPKQEAASKNCFICKPTNKFPSRGFGGFAPRGEMAQQLVEDGMMEDYESGDYGGDDF